MPKVSLFSSAYAELLRGEEHVHTRTAARSVVSHFRRAHRFSALLGLLGLLGGMVACATTPPATQARGSEPGGPELNVALIAPNLYDELVIEVGVLGTCAPEGKALAGLASFARSLLSPATVTIRDPERIPESEWPEQWHFGEFQRIVAAHMRAESGPRQQTLYVLYVDREDREAFLGGKFLHWIASSGTEARVVPGVIVVCYPLDHAANFLSRPALEEFVLKHEFGHALGLVYNPSHEHPETPGHCTDSRCLMKSTADYSVLRYLTLGLPGSPAPKLLCASCLADVSAARRRASSRPEEENRKIARRQLDLIRYSTYLELGRVPQAIELGRTLSESYPEDPDALRAGWMAHVLAGETEAALAAISRASALDTNPEAPLRSARLLCALGAYEAAASLIGSRLTPGDRDGLDVLVWALEGSGRQQEAIDSLDAFIAGESSRKRGRDRAVERQRDQGVEDARVDKARLLRLSGRAREALLEMEKLPADRRRWSPKWLIELARTSADLGDPAESRKNLLAAKDAVRYQIDHMSGAYLVASWRLVDLEIDALLGHGEIPEQTWKALLALLDSTPESERPLLGLRLAGVLAMFGDLDRAAEWCAQSQAAVTSIRDSGNDPALSDVFAAFRDSGRMRRQYPWCPSPP